MERNDAFEALSITAAILILSGCSALTMSGIGGSEKFRCSNAWNSDDPCASISSNYKASVAGVFTRRHEKAGWTALHRSKCPNIVMLTQAYSSGTPYVLKSEIARIWVAPYLDTDGI